MRSFSILILNLVLFFSLSAQNTHVARHSSVDVTGNMLLIGNKFYYMERAYAYCCTDSINLVCTNLNGNVLFKSTQFVEGFYGALRIKKSMDNGIIYGWGSFSNCDTGPDLNCFTKYDTLGQIAFNYTMTAPSLKPMLIDFVSAYDSTFYLFSQSNICHLNKSGQFISNLTYSNSPINAIELLNNGNFIINSGTNGQFMNSISNASLVTIIQNTCSVPIYKFAQRSNGTILAKDYLNNLISINSSLNQVASTACYCNDYETQGDSVYIVGYTSPAHNPFYTILNQNLQAVYSHTSSLLNFIPTGVALLSNKVKVVGYGSSSTQTQMSFNAFYNLNKIGYFNSQADIAITSMTITNWGYWGSIQGTYLVCNANVTVKNKGTQLLNNFYLNNMEPMFMCTALLHKKYTLSIAPGDSATVQTGTFLIGHDARPINALNGSPITATPCVFSSVPNGQLDADISNDSFCKTFTVGYVGIDEISQSSNEIKLWPNPFNNELKIESEFEIKTLSVKNVLGQSIKELQIDSKTIDLNTEELHQGFYFITIETEKGRLTKKIMKE